MWKRAGQGPLAFAHAGWRRCDGSNHEWTQVQPIREYNSTNLKKRQWLFHPKNKQEKKRSLLPLKKQAPNSS